MDARTKTLIDAAVALPESDRLLLVERLLETLPPESDDMTEEEFLAELDRRSADFDDGAVPWSELRLQE